MFRFLILFFISIVFVGCGNQQAIEKDVFEKHEVIKTNIVPNKESIVLLGEVVAKNKVSVRSLSNARMQEWRKNVGDTVNVGDSVLSLGGNLALEINSNLQTAILNLQAAKTELQSSKLRAESNLSKAENDLISSMQKKDLSKKIMSETMDRIRNNSNDLDGVVGLTLVQVKNKIEQMMKDFDSLLGVSSTAEVSNKLFINKVNLYNPEKFSNTKNDFLKIDRAMSGLMDVEKKVDSGIEKNQILLSSWIDISKDVSSLISQMLDMLFNTFPDPNTDSSSRSGYISLMQQYQGTIDGLLVSMGELKNRWNNLLSGNSLDQQQKFFDKELQDRLYQQSLRDYLVAFNDAKYTEQISLMKKTKAEFDFLIAQRNSQSLNGVAPISGVLSKKYKDLGAEVFAGDVLYDLVDPDNLEIQVYANKDVISFLKVGDMAKIGDDFYRVLEVSSIPSGLGNKYEIRVAANISKMNVGDYLNVEFYLNYDSGYWIPLSSIENRDSGSYVWKVNQSGSVEMIRVEVLRFGGDNVLVNGLSGENILRYGKGISPDLKIKVD